MSFVCVPNGTVFQAEGKTYGSSGFRMIKSFYETGGTIDTHILVSGREPTQITRLCKILKPLASALKAYFHIGSIIRNIKFNIPHLTLCTLFYLHKG